MSSNRGWATLKRVFAGIFAGASLFYGTNAVAQVATTTTQGATPDATIIYVAGPPETVTYTYDTRGRLIKVTHTGGSADGTNSCYSHDKSDNRTNVTVAPGPGGSCTPS